MADTVNEQRVAHEREVRQQEEELAAKYGMNEGLSREEAALLDKPPFEAWNELVRDGRAGDVIARNAARRGVKVPDWWDSWTGWVCTVVGAIVVWGLFVALMKTTGEPDGRLLGYPSFPAHILDDVQHIVAPTVQQAVDECAKSPFCEIYGTNDGDEFSVRAALWMDEFHQVAARSTKVYVCKDQQSCVSFSTPLDDA
jgi:hypothetical protein